MQINPFCSWLTVIKKEEKKINTDVIVAVFSMVGTLFGALGGILISNRLSSYRIKQLEIKVDRQNDYATRIPIAEKGIEDLKADVEKLSNFGAWASATDTQINSINHRIKSLESKIC